MSRVLYCLRQRSPFIYGGRHHPPLSSYPPACAANGTRTGRPLTPVYADFHLPRCTARTVTSRPVSSCLTFSPLPPIRLYTLPGQWPALPALPAPCGGGYFLLHCSALADSFPLRSGMPCAARTFLLRHTPAAAAGAGTGQAPTADRRKGIGRQRRTVRLHPEYL